MPLLEKWTPLPLDVMDRRMRRFFEDLGFAPALTPAADVYETDGELVVELEVPGFDEKEIEIQVSDHVLAVTGERHAATEKNKKALHVRERLEERFERRFELPAAVDSEHVTAEYAKGVLTVHVPKTTLETPQDHHHEGVVQSGRQRPSTLPSPSTGGAPNATEVATVAERAEEERPQRRADAARPGVAARRPSTRRVPAHERPLATGAGAEPSPRGEAPSLG